MTDDLLNRWTSSLRATRPPEPRAGLRDDILQFYDAQFVKQELTKPAHAPGARPRFVKNGFMSAAAAVVLGAFILLATSRPIPPVVGNEPVVINGPIVTNGSVAVPAPVASSDSIKADNIEARRAILRTRAEAIKKALEASRAPRVVTRPDPKIINKNPANAADLKRQEMERTIQSVATQTLEPVEHVYRLVAARLFENVDKQSAIDRYQELIRDYPEGAACGVANHRLQALLP